MKKMKRKRLLAAFVLLLFCGASWGLTVYGHRQDMSGLEVLRKTADEKYEKQIYDEALTAYKACLKAAPEDLHCMGRIADIYHRTGQDNNCIAWCERVLRLDAHDLGVRLLEARSYDNKKKVSSAIRVLQRAEEKDGTSAQREERDAFLRELKGRYELSYFTFEKVYPWFPLPDGSVSATVSEGENLSVYTSAGKQKLTGAFQYLGASADDNLLFPAREGQAWFFVDEKGERRLVPDRQYTSLRGFSEGLAPAMRKSGPEADSPLVAGYLDQNLQEQRFEFQEACPMVDGHALAKKDGTWFLLDSSLQETTACEFTDIKRDVYGRAQAYGVIIGKLPAADEQWALFSPEGARIGDFAAEEICLPAAEDSPLAFRRDGLWGFVSPEGEVVLEPTFEDAKSFSKGMAPVLREGKWGYIDKTGEFLIPPTFEDAEPFSKNGTAFVKNHAGYSLLKLSRYHAAGS